MATQKQADAAKRSVKKAQFTAHSGRTVAHLSGETRSAFVPESGKGTARGRGTVIELRREAARPHLEIDGRSKWARPR